MSPPAKRYYFETRCARSDGKLILQRYRTFSQFQADNALAEFMCEAFTDKEILEAKESVVDSGNGIRQTIYSFVNDFGEDVDIVRAEYPDYLSVKCGTFVLD